MRASKTVQDRVLSNPKITVHYNTDVLDIQGDDPNQPFTCVRIYHYKYMICMVVFLHKNMALMLIVYEHQRVDSHTQHTPLDWQHVARAQHQDQDRGGRQGGAL